MVSFKLKEHDAKYQGFTTRPDTIFGVTFMTLAPSSPLVQEITTQYQDKINNIF
jgi:leucyl-tRNA synthetase